MIESNVGEIELVNNDGALDYLLDYFADGRTIKLKIGATEILSGRERVKPLSSFATVYTGVAGEWYFGHDTVVLRVRNLGNRLKDRLQLQTYAGTGGKSGTADMTGRTFPTAFGRCLNVPGQLVDPSIFSIHLHGGSMDSITAVYDRGIALTSFNGDFPTYEALASAVVSDAGYASSLATGFIRVGALVDPSSVTADIRGDNQTFGNHGYVDEHGGVIKKILINYSNLVETDLDVVSFDVLDGVQPNSMGIFFPAGDQSSVEDAIELIAFSAGAFAGQDRSGLYRVKRLEAPKSKADWVFTDRDIVRRESGEPSIERLPLPYIVPWKAWGVGYQQNNTIQTSSDLALGVTQSRKRFLESEFRFVYVQSSDIAISHRTSSGAPLRRSLFASKTAAEEEAQRLIDFYSLNRSLYRIVVKTALFSVEIGQTVNLTYDRWDLSGGQNFVVVDVKDDADSVETELELFGSGDTIPYNYDTHEALTAKAENDQSYFASVLPSPVISTGVVTDAPTRPSLRGWTAISYPALSSANIGQQAKAVLVGPTYPLDGTWSDPNPSTNAVAAFVGQAPDGSTAIEIRYTSGQVPQHVDARIPFLTNVTLPGVQGMRHVGCKLEVWTPVGFNWGTAGAGGKVAGGLWGGKSKFSGLVTPWGDQDGISLRNVWGISSGSPNVKGYAYVLNRPEPEGLLTTGVLNIWLSGQWQTLEYEGYVNTPGFADGYGRMWIGSQCVAEFKRCVWALNNDFMWRGVIISDSWQDPPVATQKRWIRNLTLYHP